MPNVAFTTLTIRRRDNTPLNLDAIHTLTHVPITKRLRPGTSILRFPYKEEDYEHGDFERFSLSALLPMPKFDHYRDGWDWITKNWGSGGDSWDTEFYLETAEDDTSIEMHITTRDWYPDEWCQHLSTKLPGHIISIKAYGDSIDGTHYKEYEDGTLTLNECEEEYSDEEDD
jgi:hypothetical protein